MRDFNASPSSFVYPCWHFPYFLLRPALHHFCDSATKRQNQKQQQQHLPRRLLRCKHSASHIIFFFFLTHSHLSLLTPKHNQTSSRLANRPVIHSLSWVGSPSDVIQARKQVCARGRRAGTGENLKHIPANCCWCWWSRNWSWLYTTARLEIEKSNKPKYFLTTWRTYQFFLGNSDIVHSFRLKCESSSVTSSNATFKSI